MPDTNDAAHATGESAIAATGENGALLGTRRAALAAAAAATAGFFAEQALAPSRAQAEEPPITSVNGVTGVKIVLPGLEEKGGGVLPTVSRGNTYGAAVAYGVAQVWSPGEAVDCRPRIQEAIDGGATRIKLEGSVPFYLNSAVFDDSTTGIAEGGQDRQVVIEGNNRTHLILGPGLPTTKAFTADENVKWGFYSGTNREALKVGVVTCDEESAVNGKTQNCGPRMIFRLLVIVGAGRNAGLCFGNEAPNEIDHCNTRGLKYGLSWTGYCDGNKISDIFTHEDAGAASAGAVEGSWLMYQITNGDRVCIENISAGASNDFGVWHATQCRGGTVRNVVAGCYSFSQCTGIGIEGAHFDLTQVEGTPPIKVSQSAVTISNTYWNCDQTAGKYVLEINDVESTTAGSSVKLTNCTPVYRPTVKDTTRSADIYIAAANRNTRLYVDNTMATTIMPKGTAAPFFGNIVVASAVAKITEALNDTAYTSFNKAILGSPHWELFREGSGEAWTVGSSIPGVTAGSSLGTPELSVATTEEAEGNLVEGSKYHYAVAAKQDSGRHTIHSAEAEAAPTSAGALIVKAIMHSTPASVVVWRKKGGSPLTEPEAFAVIPASGVAMNLLDTGANLNGVPWVTASVPVPNTSFTTNTTCDTIKLPGGTELLAGEGGPNTRGIPAPLGSLYLNEEAGGELQLWVKCAKPTEGKGWAVTTTQRVTEYKPSAGKATVAAGIALALVNAETEATELTLPNQESNAGIPSGAPLTVKKIDSAAHTVTLKVEGGGTIDGKSSYELKEQYEAVQLVSSAGKYFVVGTLGPGLPI
jgi:hypothetical protein